MSTADTDRPLRQALARHDTDAVLHALEPNLRGVIAKIHAPILTRDDLLQAARIGAHAALLSFTGDRRNLRHLVGWVVLVARRHVLDEVRNSQAAGRIEQWNYMRGREFDGREVDLDLLDRRTDTEAAALNRIALRAAVDSERARRAADAAEVHDALPAHQARAFELVHVECLGYAAAADRLGVSVKTVRVYVWRGRRVLDATLPQPEQFRAGWEAA